VLLAIAIPAVTVWRWSVYDTHGWFAASLVTTTRMDGLLYGALVAVAVDLLPARARDGLSRQSAAVVGGALLVLGCASPLDSRAYAVRFLSGRRVAWLGPASLTIFVWHVPNFELLMRHTPCWSPWARTVVALALLAGVVVLVERWVARPVARVMGRLGAAPAGHRSDDRPRQHPADTADRAAPSPAPPVRGPARPDLWDDDLDWDGPVCD